MRICEICGKGTVVGGSRKKLRAHFNPQPKQKKYPNLQKSVLPGGRRALLCTSCIKNIARKSLAAVA
ncbi:MAG: 50S ribosomal protein L28 [Candidatus Colwellbacteria bacterium]|nr:50S ribosomal protein L28 [Candidatus Colwellbacteria bacterium]